MEVKKQPTKRPVGRPKRPETVVVGVRVLKEWASPVRKAIDETILKLKNKAK